jgi:agmatinase
MTTGASRFDPDAAAKPGSGMFGLPEGQPPFTPDSARVVIIPVPFDATTSYGGGAAGGPDAVRAASAQVDLYDTQFGPIYERGIAVLEADPEVIELSARARAAAAPIIEKGGSEGTSQDRAVLEAVESACARVNAIVEREAKKVLARGGVPGLLGGDHSTPYGIIKACAEHPGTGGEMGILHLDAHMDLRDAFEGFGNSHASIMHNVISKIPQVTRLVQIGLRDVGRGEIEFARAHKGRIWPHFDIDWQRELLMARGGPPVGAEGFRPDAARSFRELVADALVPLPKKVYVSFDIDALDPALCPGTGTPVPGGLSFAQACLILEALRSTKRTVVGFDLVEVSPREGDEWDANVGARMLYKLCGIC